MLSKVRAACEVAAESPAASNIVLKRRMLSALPYLNAAANPRYPGRVTDCEADYRVGRQRLVPGGQRLILLDARGRHQPPAVRNVRGGVGAGVGGQVDRL